MSKTDKELTVEIVNTVISSWLVSGTREPIPDGNLQAFIENVYETLSSLGKESKE